MKKLLFIFNPYSGRGKIKYHLVEIIDVFVKAGYDVTVYPTQYSDDAKRVVIERGKDFDRIVCSGGDGTLDEVVSGIVAANDKIPIGYIPAGSTNDFAHSLGLPKSMEAAAKVAVSEDMFACDIGRFNEEIFVYVAAFGMFTDVSYDTDQHMKNVLGHVAYVIEGARRLPAVSFYHYVIDYIDECDKHHRIEDDYLLGMVTNSKFVGGFKKITGRNVKLNDGIFEVTLVRRAMTPAELIELSDVINRGEIDMNLITTFKAKQISFVSNEPVAWTLDGEFGGNHSRIEIKNDKEAIDFVVSKK